ncbi:MAG: hypothetical protein J2P23_10435 [Microlunatus sp.]|nr:hypothetical protein [Microlunatus sp.]
MRRAAVGDVACEPDDPENSANPAALKCGTGSLGGEQAAYATADQVEAMHPDLVALLGDEQYQVAKLSDFEQSFDKTYGAFASRVRDRLATGTAAPSSSTGTSTATPGSSR